jgi:hypothetical protein
LEQAEGYGGFVILSGCDNGWHCSLRHEKHKISTPPNPSLLYSGLDLKAILNKYNELYLQIKIADLFYIFVFLS